MLVINFQRIFLTNQFLGLAVGPDPEMTPRRTVTSVAFSFRSGESNLLGGKSAQQLDQSAHVGNLSNPHAVTAAQVGALGNAELTAQTANAAAHHARYTNGEAVAAVLAADGPGSGLNADLLDGLQGSDFTAGLDQLGLSIATLQGQLVPNTGGNFTGSVTVGGPFGAGTANPLVPLHLFNSAPGTEALRIEGRDTWLAFYDGALYDGFLWNNLGDISLGTGPANVNGKVKIFTNGQERLRVSQSGRVGVGTTSPTYKFNVEDAGIAIYGRSTNNYGLYGYSSNQIGIYGYSNAISAAGVFGQSAFIGVQGITNFGVTDAGRQAVRGDNFGSATGWAGYFFGNVGVTGSVFKGGGAFRIDHPLDPKNKYLYHSFVESPDMKNIYDGVVTTDGKGIAEVALPDWFEALNKDFRYQLTVIGKFAQAIVSSKLEDNRFQITSNEPDVEVSWQITGIRKDAYAEMHRIPVEENKPAAVAGKYLHPDAFGESIDRAADFNGIHVFPSEDRLP